METSQPLTTESFSFSWLTNKSPSFNFSSDDNEETFSIIISKRFLEEEEANSFNFDLPVANSSDNNAFVHADEIFVNGHILPLYFDTKTSSSTPPIPSFSSKTIIFTRNRRKSWHFFGEWKRSSKKVLIKCFRLLVPRKSIRVDDIGRKVWEIKSLSNSDNSSPHKYLTTRSSNSGECSSSKGISKMQRAKSWSNSTRESPARVLPYSYSSKDACFDRESSVNEAVLHCKRSFGEGNSYS